MARVCQGKRRLSLDVEHFCRNRLCECGIRPVHWPDRHFQHFYRALLDKSDSEVGDEMRDYARVVDDDVDCCSRVHLVWFGGLRSTDCRSSRDFWLRQILLFDEVDQFLLNLRCLVVLV